MSHFKFASKIVKMRFWPHFQTQTDFYNKRSENETIFEGRYLNVFLKSEQTLEITHVLLKKRETLTQIDSTLPLNDK